MKIVTENEAKDIFTSGGEVWVYTGDYGKQPMFEYELDEDGDQMLNEQHKLMHPKSLDFGDNLESFIYNNYYTA